MITKSRNSGKRGSRRGGSPQSDSSRSHKRPTPPCSICKEPIQDLISALACPPDGVAVHFDCAIKTVEKILNSRKGEKVIYHGKGCFAVVDSQSYQRKKLKILRSIDWEHLEETAEWRKKLRTSIR